MKHEIQLLIDSDYFIYYFAYRNQHKLEDGSIDINQEAAKMEFDFYIDQLRIKYKTNDVIMAMSAPP